MVSGMAPLGAESHPVADAVRVSAYVMSGVKSSGAAPTERTTVDPFKENNPA